MPIKTLGSLGKIRVGRVTGNSHIFLPNITGDDSAVSVTKQMTTGIGLDVESVRTYEKEDDHSKIL